MMSQVHLTIETIIALSDTLNLFKSVSFAHTASFQQKPFVEGLSNIENVFQNFICLTVIQVHHSLSCEALLMKKSDSR